MKRVIAVLLLLAAGCGNPEPSAPDTGARAAAEEFFGGLVAKEPSRAYATLHPDSTKRLSAEQFAALARGYVKNVGFPAEKVAVHASEEQGDRATVHVTLIGHGGGQTRRYSDGVTLRREADRWFVVLPTNFGKK